MLEIIHQLEQIDTEVFLFFNGMHCELFDYFMMIVSHRFAWIPFYAAFIWVMIVNFHWKVTLTTILAVALRWWNDLDPAIWTTPSHRWCM